LKYACKQCEETIKRAKLPKFILPKSFASASLLAYLVVSKHIDHLPLNRLENQLKRFGIYLPRSTQSDWLLALADKLQPLVEIMNQIILSSPRICPDNTILPIQNDNPKRNKLIQTRLWVFICGPLKDLPLVVYDYSKTRSSKWPIEKLKDFRGYKHADGFPGYKALHRNDNVKFVACYTQRA